MKPRTFSLVFVVTCTLATSGCAQALLGDETYVLDVDAGTGGGASGGGGNEPIASSTSSGDVACSGGLTACDGICVELSSDSGHCGECGHDCLGTSCEEGLCSASLVVSGILNPVSFTVDGTHVYWTTSGGLVQRAPKTGGGPMQTVAQENGSLGVIVVDAESVFWVNEDKDKVMQAPKDGSGNPKKLSKGSGPRRLAQDESSIYYTRKIKKGDIRSTEKGSGVEATLVAEQDLPSDLHLASDHLYWTGLSEDPDSGNIGGYVRVMSRFGGTATTLAAGEGEISALATVGETVVWSDRTNQRIRAFGPGVALPMTLVDDQDVRGLTGDHSTVYWSTAGGNVKARTLKSSTIRPLAIDITNAGALVVDDTHVYILRTGANGSILRVVK